MISVNPQKGMNFRSCNRIEDDRRAVTHEWRVQFPEKNPKHFINEEVLVSGQKRSERKVLNDLKQPVGSFVQRWRQSGARNVKWKCHRVRP